MENKTAYLKKLGTNIKEIRKSKNQEVKEAAKGLGVTVQALGALENGKVDFNITRIFDIAQYYNVEIGEVLKTTDGDVINFTSQNNSGGYHVLNKGVMNVTDESLKEYLENEILTLKQKLVYTEAAFQKSK